MDGAEAVGDPLGTLPVLYHLMWRHWLVADLSVQNQILKEVNAKKW